MELRPAFASETRLYGRIGIRLTILRSSFSSKKYSHCNNKANQAITKKQQQQITKATQTQHHGPP
jgi:ribosomal protein S3